MSGGGGGDFRRMRLLGVSCDATTTGASRPARHRRSLPDVAACAASTREHSRVFFEDRGREARSQHALMDGKQD
jgi:hypothetical protein